MNAIQEARRQGQAICLGYIHRGLIKSGEFRELIEQGISGATSNPTIFEKAIVGSTDYDETILTLAKNGRNTESVYESLAAGQAYYQGSFKTGRCSNYIRTHWQTDLALKSLIVIYIGDT